MEENILNQSENYINIESTIQSQLQLEQQALLAQEEINAIKTELQQQQEEDEEQFNNILLGVNQDIEYLKEGGVTFPPPNIAGILVDAIVQKLLEKMEPYKSLILQAIEKYKKINPDITINSKTIREAWNKYIWDPTSSGTPEEDQIIPGGLKQYMDESVMKEQIKNEVDKLVDLYKSLIDTIKNFGLSLSTLPAAMAPFTGGGAPAAVPSMMFNLLSQLSTIINMATGVMGSVAYLKPPADLFKSLVDPIRAMLAPIIEIKKMIMGFISQGMTIPAFDPEKTPILGFRPMTDQNIPDPEIYLAVKDYGKIKTGLNKVPSRYFRYYDSTYQIGNITTATGSWSLRSPWNWDTYWKEVEEYNPLNGYKFNDIVIYNKIINIESNPEGAATELTGEYSEDKTFWRCIAEHPNWLYDFMPYETEESIPGEGYWLENWVEVDPSGPQQYDKTKEYRKGERVLYTLYEYENVNDTYVAWISSNPPPANAKKVTRIYQAVRDIDAQYKELDAGTGETEIWENDNISGMFAEYNFTGSYGYGNEDQFWLDVTPRPGYIYGPGDLIGYKKKIWYNIDPMPAIFEVEEEDEEEDED